MWKAAIEFALSTFEFTSRTDFRGLGDTKSQLERAVLSVSNNIAEGFERGTTSELIHFLYIARGSVGESRSMLCLCESVPKFDNFKSEISNLKLRAENISRQLHGWLESLKNTQIKGVKYLTRSEMAKVAQNKEFEEFDREMDRYRQELIERLNQRQEAGERMNTEDL